MLGLSHEPSGPELWCLQRGQLWAGRSQGSEEGKGLSSAGTDSHRMSNTRALGSCMGSNCRCFLSTKEVTCR